MKSQVRLSRSSHNVWTLRITDELSRVTVAEIELDEENFSNLMSASLAYGETRYGNLNLVGNIQKTITILIQKDDPKRLDYAKNALEQLGKNVTVSYRSSDYDNMHYSYMYEGIRYQTVVFYISMPTEHPWIEKLDNMNKDYFYSEVELELGNIK